MRLIRGNVERVTDSEKEEARLKAEGFKPVDGPGEADAPEGPLDFSEMTVAELRKHAKKMGLEGCASLSKDELLEILKDEAL